MSLGTEQALPGQDGPPAARRPGSGLSQSLPCSPSRRTSVATPPGAPPAPSRVTCLSRLEPTGCVGVWCGKPGPSPQVRLLEMENMDPSRPKAFLPQVTGGVIGKGLGAAPSASRSVRATVRSLAAAWVRADPARAWLLCEDPGPAL